MRPSIHFLLWCLGLAEPETQTTLAERACLAHHAAGRKRLVEIGVWHAVTTCRLRSVMAPDGILLLVDPYPAGRLGFSIQRVIARNNIDRIRNGSVEWLRLTGVEAAAKHPQPGEVPVDFVFIDGDHTYEGLRGDWRGWSPLVASGGIVALHDSRSSAIRSIESAGSVVFTREVILQDSHFKLIDAVDTLSIFQRQVI